MYPKTLLNILAVAAIGILVHGGSANAALPLQKDVIIKASGDAVYYYASNNKRYVFPNQQTYHSWFQDFSGVITVTDSELASLRIGGNVTYRPGVRMIKITSDPKVYAVDSAGTLRWITSEAVATTLFGADWNTQIDDISDAFFVNYSVGNPIYTVSDYNRTTIASNARTINADKSLPVSSSPRLSDTDAGEGEVYVTPSPEVAEDTTFNDTWRVFALQHINSIRAEHGKDPVVINERLNAIAQRHSADMAVYIKAMSHDGSLGEDASDRIKRGQVPNIATHTFETLPFPAGIGWSGENVGMRNINGFGGDIETAIVHQHEWFMDEPVDEYNHRTTMLSTLIPFTTVGIGLYLDEQNNLWITEDYISN